jgi:hypothetical protein
MKVVSADSSCPVVWWGCKDRLRACAEVSTGSVAASKAKHGPGLHMEPSIYGRIFGMFGDVLKCRIQKKGMYCLKVV